MRPGAKYAEDFWKALGSLRPQSLRALTQWCHRRIPGESAFNRRYESAKSAVIEGKRVACTGHVSVGQITGADPTVRCRDPGGEDSIINLKPPEKQKVLPPKCQKYQRSAAGVAGGAPRWRQ